MSSSVGGTSEDTDSGGGARAGGDEDGDTAAVEDPELNGTSVGSNGFSSAACRRRQKSCAIKSSAWNIPGGARARRWIGEGSTPPSSTFSRTCLSRMRCGRNGVCNFWAMSHKFSRAKSRAIYYVRQGCLFLDAYCGKEASTSLDLQ